MKILGVDVKIEFLLKMLNVFMILVIIFAMSHTNGNIGGNISKSGVNISKSGVNISKSGVNISKSGVNVWNVSGNVSVWNNSNVSTKNITFPSVHIVTDSEGRIPVIVYFNAYPSESDFKAIESYGGYAYGYDTHKFYAGIKIKEEKIPLLYKIRNVISVETDEPVQLCCGDDDQ